MNKPSIGERWFAWWLKTTPRAIAYGILFGMVGYAHFVWWAERHISA
jgi:hypothetical protein